MHKVAFAVLAALFGASVYAGDSTLSYTTAQSTAIQTRLIPRYNADRCARVGLGPSCTTAELGAAGCQVVTIRTVVIESCVIFTTNAAGEAAYLKEMASQGVVATFNSITALEHSLYNTAECARWKALSAPNQQAECTARGLPTTCAGPCP